MWDSVFVRSVGYPVLFITFICFAPELFSVAVYGIELLATGIGWVLVGVIVVGLFILFSPFIYAGIGIVFAFAAGMAVFAFGIFLLLVLFQ
ncbi:hypothetical protein OPW41_16040 [Vibrio europaeus]|nr:hypothetical protein [Vibrio europaeus]MDC5703797.1 hypothetical protein [Vibrio europaeus]MDC5708249.1 hypothetical protein [Vibrio europaeus]MDC5714344.1 hypothetical protein [Vibrio europaeus]MDC5722545.1 hypothetical protein [Vibrio europaeus]MDC5727174.1 hypothetical protein [Vibrio europaeus]